MATNPHPAPDTDVIVEREVTLPTTLDDTWELLTDADELAGWLGADVDLDPTPGASGNVVDHDGTRRRVVVDEVEHGSRLVWRWWVDGDDAAGRVEIILSPAPDGARVTVIERLVPAPPSASASARAMSAAATWDHRLLHLELRVLVTAFARV